MIGCDVCSYTERKPADGADFRRMMTLAAVFLETLCRILSEKKRVEAFLTFLIAGRVFIQT